MRFPVVQIQPSKEHLFGAGAGQRDLSALKTFIEESSRGSFVTAFDFAGSNSVSGSYLRATIGWCLACGRMFTEGRERQDFSDPWAIRPLSIYPVVVGASREVLEEIHDFLVHRDLACLLVDSKQQLPFDRMAVLGRLDEFLFATLQRLGSMATATAQEMLEGSREKITVGGWSNRLVALLANRLVTRTKEGKTWRYEALGKEYKLWA